MKFPLLTRDMVNEFELRLSKVRMAMVEARLDAVLVGSTVNLFYLTGGVCRGYMYIPVDREPVFFVIPPAEPVGEIFSQIRKPEQIPDLLAAKGYDIPARIGLEFDDLYYSEIERLRKVFASSEIADGSRVMRRARLVKTPYEVDRMREDGLRHCAVYSRIDSCYREGMTDLEFQIEIEHVLRMEGCLGFLRVAGSRMEINMGSLLAGPNADVPSPYDFSMGGAGVDPSLPVGASGIIMKPGMSVMVDMNGGFNGYQTDMTRCWTVGEAGEKAQRAHECSRAILRDLESFARPGVEAGELYRRAARIAEEAGLSSCFMGHAHKVAFIGHGVGIELNEAPVLMGRDRTLLEENMTLAIEPKFVIPEVGALGVENTYVVTDGGLENLTPFNENLAAL
ncbi:MAG: Xaa-Pro peptidase family protein [Muribaculaceae bacterium]|nr:Xaa-Pro peptidase family protein [Muribaculaceae bacterium]